MKQDRFEDLRVCRSAIELGVRVYTLTVKKEFRDKASLRDQINRATVSRSNVTRERKEILQELRRIQKQNIARSRSFSRKK